MVLAGVLPFGAVFIELFFIFSVSNVHFLLVVAGPGMCWLEY